MYVAELKEYQRKLENNTRLVYKLKKRYEALNEALSEVNIAIDTATRKKKNTGRKHDVSNFYCIK